MADHSNNSEAWEDLSKIAGRVLVPDVTKKSVVDLYDQWAQNGYDKIMDSKARYQALDILQQTVEELFPKARDSVVLLDVGAGTGLSGERLRNAGFRCIDALDPSSEMLLVAKKKQIYRNMYNCYLTGQPTQDIAADSYDCVSLVGVMGHGCLPCEAFKEISRIVKPGGFIVNCLRGAFMKEVPEYSQNWEPLKDTMVKEGRWKVVKMDPYPNHFMGHEGLLMVLQVLQ